MTINMTTKITARLTLSLASLTLLAAAGCKKTADTPPNYTAAINAFYSAHPACLWTEPIKFPVQANTSDTTKTSGYDALVDQGLLTRTSGEKKEMILFSKQVTNYDISDKGRGAWKPDPNQPGFGNFCYGTPTVTSIDGNTLTNAQPGATTNVHYHVGIRNAPAWATAPETQNAFPGVQTQLSNPIAAVATLTDTSNGWVVTQGPSFKSMPASNADGTLVQ